MEGLNFKLKHTSPECGAETGPLHCLGTMVIQVACTRIALYEHYGGELKKKLLKQGAFWQARRGMKVKIKNWKGMKPAKIAKDNVFQQSRRNALLTEDMRNTWQCK